MDPVLINFGFISIRWYSILILFGFIIGYYLVIFQAKRKGISKVLINDISFNLIILSIVGARIYYCLFNLDYYLKYPIEILKI